MNKGVVPLGKSKNIDHIKKNIASTEFKMEENDYKLIDSLEDPLIDLVRSNQHIFPCLPI